MGMFGGKGLKVPGIGDGPDHNSISENGDVVAKAHAIAARLRGENGGAPMANAITVIDPGSAGLDTTDKLLDYLGRLDNALTETYDIADVLKIKKNVEAVQFLRDKMELDQSIKTRATESQIRTQRRLGELLLTMPKNRGTRLEGRTEDGDPRRLQDATAETYEELGIEKTAAHRWQTMAKIPAEKLEGFITSVKESGNELTAGGAHAYARNVLKLGPLMSSDSPEWYTTRDIIDACIAVMGAIDLDPCSNSHDTPNVPANQYFTKEDDGLAQQWLGRVYMNPPYGDAIPHWVDKLNREYLERRTTQAIVLLPARPDTAWFRSLRDYPRCFMFGRVRFNDAPNSAPFPTMLVSVGCDRDRFIEVMSTIGDIYERVDR